MVFYTELNTLAWTECFRQRSNTICDCFRMKTSNQNQTLCDIGRKKSYLSQAYLGIFSIQTPETHSTKRKISIQQS